MRRFIGIDVSERRGCAIACIDETGRSAGSLWSASSIEDVRLKVRDLVGDEANVPIGIDSPRTPVDVAREWYWDGQKRRWRARAEKDRGWGRHSEVVISVSKLANPQWTPPKADAPAWMCLGFDLFPALESLGDVFEVFPTASYAQLDSLDTSRVEMSLAGFSRGPKDMLDAYVSALTVRDYVEKRGVSVGGGDGLGAIVLPRPLRDGVPAGLLEWPTLPSSQW